MCDIEMIGINSVLHRSQVMVENMLLGIFSSHTTTAGPAFLQVKEDGSRPAAGGMDQQPGPHHVFLQTGHGQV